MMIVVNSQTRKRMVLIGCLAGILLQTAFCVSLNAVVRKVFKLLNWTLLVSTVLSVSMTRAVIGFKRSGTKVLWHSLISFLVRARCSNLDKIIQIQKGLTRQR